MARKNTKRVDTARLQDKGSYIVIKRPTVGATNELKDAVMPIYDKYRDANGAVPDAKIMTVMSAEDMDELNVLTRQYWADHIVSWNWVDDAEQPLAQPGEDVTVFDLLTDDEFAFIRKQFEPDLTQEKKVN